MGDIILRFNEKEREELKRFSRGIAIMVTVFALLGFWVGVDFMKESIFKNYFNPTRHVIVEQDPDTMEVYAWKDALGHVYTHDNPDVKNFPYGIMVLMLIVMGISMQAYNLMVEHYAMMQLIKGRAGNYDLIRSVDKVGIGSPSPAN